MDITDSPIQLENMYKRKSNTYAEHRTFPYITEDDFRMDLFEKIRNLAKSHQVDHPWIQMSDKNIITRKMEHGQFELMWSQVSLMVVS